MAVMLSRGSPVVLSDAARSGQRLFRDDGGDVGAPLNWSPLLASRSLMGTVFVSVFAASLRRTTPVPPNPGAVLISTRSPQTDEDSP